MLTIVAMGSTGCTDRVTGTSSPDESTRANNPATWSANSLHWSGNPGDPLILRYKGADNRLRAVYGVKDGAGVPLRLTRIEVYALGSADSVEARSWHDSLSRPIVFENIVAGSSLKVSYDVDDQMTLTAIDSAGSVVAVTRTAMPKELPRGRAQNGRAVFGAGRMAQPTVPTGRLITRCAGKPTRSLVVGHGYLDVRGITMSTRIDPQIEPTEVEGEYLYWLPDLSGQSFDRDRLEYYTSVFLKGACMAAAAIEFAAGVAAPTGIGLPIAIVAAGGTLAITVACTLTGVWDLGNDVFTTSVPFTNASKWKIYFTARLPETYPVSAIIETADLGALPIVTLDLPAPACLPRFLVETPMAELRQVGFFYDTQVTQGWHLPLGPLGGGWVAPGIHWDITSGPERHQADGKFQWAIGPNFVHGTYKLKTAIDRPWGLAIVGHQLDLTGLSEIWVRGGASTKIEFAGYYNISDNVVIQGCCGAGIGQRLVIPGVAGAITSSQSFRVTVSPSKMMLRKVDGEEYWSVGTVFLHAASAIRCSGNCPGPFEATIGGSFLVLFRVL